MAIPTLQKRMGKTEVQEYIATAIADALNIDFTKAKKAVRVMESSMIELIQEDISKSGEFNLLGLFTIRGKYKPAQKGGEKKHNHLTGQDYITKDKPESITTKVLATKKLKDIIASEADSVKKIERKKERIKKAKAGGSSTVARKATTTRSAKTTAKKTVSRAGAKRRVVKRAKA